MKAVALLFLAAVIAGCASHPPDRAVTTSAVNAPDPDMFILRSTTKSLDAVVGAIQHYAQERNWNYLGSFKVKQGQVTLVKLCIPEIGQQLWPLGLHISAMLPCGNIAVYPKNGHTEISLLHPRYMQILYPDPAVARASTAAEPLLLEMLDTVAE